MTTSVYAISGMPAGIGGVLLTSRLGAGIPTAINAFCLRIAIGVLILVAVGFNKVNIRLAAGRRPPAGR